MARVPPDPANLLVFATAPESADAFDVSDPEVLEALERSQEEHFWFDARNRQILDFLRRDGAAPPRRFLEVGCGTGTVLAALSRAGYEVTGIEMHERLGRAAALANPASRIYALDVDDPPDAFRRELPFDVVGVFDVIEHLENPARFLRSCAAWLRPGGLLVGTVPALSWLWSDYDAFAGHRIRHDRGTLETTLTDAGLSAPACSYFFQFLLPAMAARRFLIGRREGSRPPGERRSVQKKALEAPGGLIRSAFQAACSVERRLHRVFPLGSIPGTSLWFSARVA